MTPAQLDALQAAAMRRIVEQINRMCAQQWRRHCEKFSRERFVHQLKDH